MSVAGPGALGVDWLDTVGHADEASKPREWKEGDKVTSVVVRTRGAEGRCSLGAQKACW